MGIFMDFKSLKQIYIYTLQRRTSFICLYVVCNYIKKLHKFVTLICMHCTSIKTIHYFDSSVLLKSIVLRTGYKNSSVLHKSKGLKPSCDL